METRTNLDKWLYLVRRIEEHREEKAVKDLQKLYKKLIKDLRKVMGNVYADYADPATGKLTYEALHRQGLDARLLEEVAANVASVTADEGRIIRETVEQTYANCYSGMVQAVQNAVDNEELHEAFAAVEAVKPEVIKAAVNNPVHGLTLSDQLEKNRADIIWGIKQAVGVGLSEGDNYSTMARRIQKELIGRDGSGGSYYKSIRIARTEAHRVREEGNLDAAQNLTEKLEPAGISMMKTWHTMKDERVRPSRSRKTKGGWKYSKSGKYDHQKMEGVQVPINEEFELPSGAKTMAPGKSGVAGEDINCRCFLSYDVVKSEASYMASENTNDWSDAKPREVSSQEKEELIKYANTFGILIPDLNDFDGDQELLRKQIDVLAELQKKFPTGKRLWFRPSRYLEDDDFGMTEKGRNISINRVALRNRQITIENLTRDGQFVAKTPEDIVRHEYGHVLLDGVIGKRGLEIARTAYYNVYGEVPSDKTLIRYLKNNISGRCVVPKIHHNGNISYREIGAEVFAKNEVQATDFTKEFLSLCLGGR